MDAPNFSIQFTAASNSDIMRIKDIFAKEALDCQTIYIYQYHRKSAVKSTENMHADDRENV